MKIQNFLMLAMAFALSSCKLLVCAAKADKYLPEDEQESTKVAAIKDTAALILNNCINAELQHNPKEPMAGGTTVYYDSIKLKDWHYKKDTIVATLIKWGEAKAAIPDYPKQIKNAARIYRLYKNLDGFYTVHDADLGYDGATVINFEY